MLRISYVIGLLVFLVNPARSDWILNGTGPNSPYQLWLFGDDGIPKTLTATIPLSADTTNIAWPSAIRVNGEISVYASAVDSSAWSAVRLWTSSDSGMTFRDQGVVFSADAELEPNGVGPAHVVYDTAQRTLYIMYYLVRGARGSSVWRGGSSIRPTRGRRRTDRGKGFSHCIIRCLGT